MELLTLTEPQLEKLIENIDRLWYDGHILLNPTETGIQVGMKRIETEKILIPDLDQSTIPDIISAGVAFADMTLIKKNVKEIAKYFDVSEEQEHKLSKLITEFKKLKSVHEISYLSNTNSPTMDLKTFDYNTKIFADSNIDIPIASINFDIRSRGEKQSVFFETTKSELKNLSIELKKVEKDLEVLEERKK